MRRSSATPLQLFSIVNSQFSIVLRLYSHFPISDFRFTRRHYTWVHPRVNHIRFYNAINYLLLFDAKVKRLVLAMWINEDKRG